MTKSYNKRQLSRIYPKGTRVGSENYMPQVSPELRLYSFAKSPTQRRILEKKIQQPFIC